MIEMKEIIFLLTIFIIIMMYWSNSMYEMKLKYNCEHSQQQNKVVM